MDELRKTLQRARSTEGTYPPSILTRTLSRDSPADVVPTAAVLLEYSVAYVPAGSQSGPFLSNVDLEVFACSLGGQAEAPGQHPQTDDALTFLQFSCPVSQINEVGDIAGRLRDRFGARISAARISRTLHVNHRTERLDRVAL